MHPNDLRQHLAHIAEDRAYHDLTQRGYSVHSNGYHDHADLIVNNRIKVEVKASLWVNLKNRAGRYQFNTRNRPDIYLLYCIGTSGICFVIPDSAIGERRNVAITSQDPHTYAGQWATYLDAWDIIERILERCQNQPAQSTVASSEW